MPAPLCYAFDAYRLVPDERALTCAGRAVRLGGRAFDVLLTLVEHRDRTVTKHELFERVWPKLVVEENNLQVQIAGLRKLLGPQSIATIPGRGYRFTLPVAVDGGTSPQRNNAGPQETRAATRPHTNLPACLPALYGREADLDAVRSLLAAHGVVTIAGAGGIGKTRVAQAVGAAVVADHPDGVCWIELAALVDPALVVPTIARALGIPLTGDHDPLDAVLAALRPRRALLVLDSCEHLLDAVATFVDALRAAVPHVKVLVTSQEPLRARDEHVHRLGPLSLPGVGPADARRREGAIDLFAARARAFDPRFALDAATLPAVIEVCRRLDGIPLAIELAAARLPLLGLDGLRSRLDERFKLLTAGSRVVLRRHQTLRAALEWSHGLLAPDEQAVFRRLGVFAGSFTLEFAQTIAACERIDAWTVLDVLGALVDKSLVLADGDPVPRYRLLETTRAYALEKLAEAGETEGVLRRHGQSLVDWLEPLLDRRRQAPLDPSEEGILAPELDNVRATLDWACAGDDDELAIAVAGYTWIVWAYGNAGREAWQRCVALRNRVRPGLARRVAAQFWNAIASLGAFGAKPETFDAALREVALLRELGDEHRLYAALQRLAIISSRRGDVAAARKAIDEALRLERPEWPPRQRANLQWALRAWMELQGRHEEALAHALRQAELYGDEDGLDDFRRQALGTWVAGCEINLGRVAEGRARARAELAAGRSDREGWGHVHEVLALAATLLGEHDVALAHGRRALPELRRLGDEARLLDTLALGAAQQGRLAEAAVVAGFVDAELARNGEVRWPAAAQRRAHLDALLAARLPAEDVVRLQGAGARMGPDGVHALALGEAATRI